MAFSPAFKTTDISSHLNQLCPICLDGFDAEGLVTVLPCHHIYHQQCASRWLVESAPGVTTCTACTEVPKALSESMEVLKETEEGKGD